MDWPLRVRAEEVLRVDARVDVSLEHHVVRDLGDLLVVELGQLLLQLVQADALRTAVLLDQLVHLQRLAGQSTVVRVATAAHCAIPEPIAACSSRVQTIALAREFLGRVASVQDLQQVRIHHVRTVHWRDLEHHDGLGAALVAHRPEHGHVLAGLDAWVLGLRAAVLQPQVGIDAARVVLQLVDDARRRDLDVSQDGHDLDDAVVEVEDLDAVLGSVQDLLNDQRSDSLEDGQMV